jgi:hypothetical protein
MRVDQVAHRFVGDFANFGKNQLGAGRAGVGIEVQDVLFIDDDDGVGLPDVGIAHGHELVNAAGDFDLFDVAAGTAHVFDVDLLGRERPKRRTARRWRVCGGWISYEFVLEHRRISGVNVTKRERTIAAGANSVKLGE